MQQPLPPDISQRQLDLARDHVQRYATPSQIAELERLRTDGSQAGNDAHEIAHWAKMAQTDSALGDALYGDRYAVDQDAIDDDAEMMRRPHKAADTSIAALAEAFYGDDNDADDDDADTDDDFDETYTPEAARLLRAGAARLHRGTPSRTPPRRHAANDTSVAAIARSFYGDRQ